MNPAESHRISNANTQVINHSSESPGFLDSLLERNWLPDWLIRLGIRRLLAERLQLENKGSLELQQDHLMQFVAMLKHSPIAVNTLDANQQHYEVPAEFFQKVLGRHLKYSSGYWAEGIRTLGDAEASMLELVCERAEIRDGQRILELGCGWGSLALWISQHYPRCQITGV